MSFINKCHGKHHKVFLIDTSCKDDYALVSTLNIAKRNFCVFKDYNTNGFWNEIVALIRRKFLFANTIIEIIMRLNIAEGFLYFRVLSHINCFSSLWKRKSVRTAFLYVLVCWFHFSIRLTSFRQVCAPKAKNYENIGKIITKFFLRFVITFLYLFVSISTYREHKSSMMRLKKLLSDTSKNRRSRRKIFQFKSLFWDGWLSFLDF